MKLNEVLEHTKTNLKLEITKIIQRLTKVDTSFAKIKPIEDYISINIVHGNLVTVSFLYQNVPVGTIQQHVRPHEMEAVIVPQRKLFRSLAHKLLYVVEDEFDIEDWEVSADHRSVDLFMVIEGFS